MAKSMFYTKAARVIVVFALIVGVLSFLFGLVMVFGVTSPDVESTKYIWKSGFQSMSSGIYCILFAVVLGVLSEISQSLSDLKQNN